jgi:hypothetical protein
MVIGVGYWVLGVGFFLLQRTPPPLPPPRGRGSIEGQRTDDGGWRMESHATIIKTADSLLLTADFSSASLLVRL